MDKRLRQGLGHAVRIGLLTFIISLTISLLFEFALAVWLSTAILILVILTGIFFDIIGTAVTVAKEGPFHAMGADKVRGSKEAVYLIRHAGQVANICNDVVGDIAGTISGAVWASIVLALIRNGLKTPQDLTRASGIALIAALTVGGKAFGKSFAIGRADRIMFYAGKFLAWIHWFRVDVKKEKRKQNKPGSRKGKKKNG